MPHQKLSEYRAKRIISETLGLPYQGWPVNTATALAPQLKAPAAAASRLVVKVDEGVKGRFKKGLVKLNVAPKELPQAVTELSAKGYRWLIIEPMVEHPQGDERYMSIISDREGLLLHYSASGGVDIEQHAHKLQRVRLGRDTDWTKLAADTGIAATRLKNLAAAFKDNYFVFLEINPYLAVGESLHLLDAAVEVDDAGMFFEDTWKADDFRRHSGQKATPQEQIVEELDAKSPASFKLSVLEPNGAIFLLLSGGGASVVVADEVYNQGYGKQLANYGEYSGNPNTEETYIYTRAVLELLLASNAGSKVLFIGGAVANFTDIAKTFAGVIQAINEVAGKLSAEHVKVFVRRGGPNQEAGLAQLQATLAGHGLLGAVHDPGTALTVAVGEALQEISHE